MNISTFILSILFILFIALVGNENRLFVVGQPETKQITLYALEETDESNSALLNDNGKAAVKTLTKKAYGTLHASGVNAFWAELSVIPDEIQGNILVNITSQLSDEKSFKIVSAILTKMEQSQRIDLHLQFDYARSLSKDKKADTAIIEYQALLSHNPAHQAAAINLGILLNRQGRHKEVISALTPSLSLSAGKKKAKLLSLIGSGYKALENWKKSEKRFRESINYRPGHGMTWLNLAQVQRSQQYPYSVVKLSYERALSLLPEQHSGWFELGSIALQAGDFELAMETLKKAANLNPQHSKTRLQLAWALFENNLDEESIEHWKWLSMHGSRKSYRLTARHMQTILNGEENHLKPLHTSQQEKTYVNALRLARQQHWSASLETLNKISSSSPFYLRSLIRQKNMHLKLNNKTEVNHYNQLIESNHLHYDGSALVTPMHQIHKLKDVNTIENVSCIESINREYA